MRWLQAGVIQPRGISTTDTGIAFRKIAKWVNFLLIIIVIKIIVIPVIKIIIILVIKIINILEVKTIIILVILIKVISATVHQQDQIVDDDDDECDGDVKAKQANRKVQGWGGLPFNVGSRAFIVVSCLYFAALYVGFAGFFDIYSINLLQPGQHSRWWSKKKANKQTGRSKVGVDCHSMLAQEPTVLHCSVDDWNDDWRTFLLQPKVLCSVEDICTKGLAMLLNHLRDLINARCVIVYKYLVFEKTGEWCV